MSETFLIHQTEREAVESLKRRHPDFFKESSSCLIDSPRFKRSKSVEIVGMGLESPFDAKETKPVHVGFYFKGDITRFNRFVRKLFKKGKPIIVAHGHISGILK